MPRARALAVAVLLLSYGAVGARQPAVRAAVPLPVPAWVVSSAAGLASADPSTLLLRVVRLLYDAPDDPATPEGRRRAAIRAVLSRPNDKGGDAVPLPLDPSIWRETILERPVPDRGLAAAILGNRDTALLYYGLAALDDQTLAWLGPDRETLQHLRQHAALFAAFGRSIHVGAGRVLVPGGAAAEPLWASLTGVEPERPAAFIQRLFRDDDGRLALLYDAVAHLDESRQRFALGRQLPALARDARLRALLEAFARDDWQPSVQPFSRPSLDGSVLLSTLAVTGTGEASGPMTRGVWDRVFRDDAASVVSFSIVEPDEAPRETDAAAVDAAWLAARISRVPFELGRRRLDTVLFAQRVFSDETDPAAAADALRGFASFPALMLTLERVGLTGADVYANAARHAARLTAINPVAGRRAAIVEFQSALGIVERTRRAGATDGATAESLVKSLIALEVSPERGYDSRLSAWVREQLLTALPPAAPGCIDPAETTVLAAMAGVTGSESPASTIDWRDVRYRVDPAGAALRRLRRFRERQGGPSLDAALAPRTERRAESMSPEGPESVLADTLSSILYSAYLGEPGSPAVMPDNAALRHDLGLAAAAAGSRAPGAWQLPYEEVNAKGGWRVRGSLLGLESALARFSLRPGRPGEWPRDTKGGGQDRHTVALTVALLGSRAVSDSARDEIAASLGRGRARASALTADPAHLDRVAREAGLSEWRRQALAWTVERNPGAALTQFSPLELFWLGGPHPSATEAVAAWGIAATPRTGCLCLQMPARRDWEERSGRSPAGALTTQAADTSLLAADALASLQLPASLAPEILAFAAQDALDRAEPPYPDDWPELGPSHSPLSRERVMEYVGALTANGPLVRVAAASR